jgi:hypothetical protein
MNKLILALAAALALAPAANAATDMNHQRAGMTQNDYGGTQVADAPGLIIVQGGRTPDGGYKNLLIGDGRVIGMIISTVPLVSMPPAANGRPGPRSEYTPTPYYNSAGVRGALL